MTKKEELKAMIDKMTEEQAEMLVEFIKSFYFDPEQFFGQYREKGING